jgi:DNA mismatch endonuclease (patch repair protein)
MDTISAERRSANMRRIKSQDTTPEMVVRRLVHGMGYRFRLHVASLPGKPDLVLPRLASIIEVRGCFWHQHSGCIDTHIPESHTAYWAPKLARNKQRDQKNGRALRALGWRLCVVWECETKDKSKLAMRLAKFLSGSLV